MLQFCRPIWWIALAIGLQAGCQGSNNRASLFGPVHPLTEQARALKSAYPEPLPLARELAKTPMKPYIVEPGDILLVHPVNMDSPVRLPGDQPVLPDGRIQLGAYGMPLVAGKTLEQIEAEINILIRSRTRDAGLILVRLVNRDSKVYYVLGEVNAPGVFQLRGRETVLDGILAAGGLTSGASRRDIILSRPTKPDSCRLVLPVCYNEIVQLGDTSTNYQLRPGDRIYVPSRSFLEWLCPHEKCCLPCGRPQFPCPVEHEVNQARPGPPPPDVPPPPRPLPDEKPPQLDLPRPTPSEDKLPPSEKPSGASDARPLQRDDGSEAKEGQSIWRNIVPVKATASCP